NGFPLDGVAVELSHDGGLNYTEALALNGLLTTARGTFDKGAHGLPQITVGLIDEDFTNQFRFRFHFFSDAQNTGVGCQIDDVTLRVVSGSEYIFISGTSYASAVVAGLASLLWDYRPALSAAAMKNLILTTGENLPALSGKTVTGKRINAFLAFASSYDPAVVDLRGFVSSGGTEFFDGNTIPTASPYFSWTAPTGQGTITGYLYAVDGTPSGSVTTTSTFVSLSGLGEGAHTFSVVGVNSIGSQGTVRNFAFTVDTVAPPAPTNFSVNGGTNVVNASNVSSTSISVTVGENGTFNYRFSDGAHPNVSGSQAVTAGNVSVTGLNLSGLNEGALSLVVSLADAVGNTSSDVTRSVQKNSVAPVVTDGSISISGGTGTGGAYIVGNTLVVKWDNSVSGNNNPDVASVFANLSGWGGGSSVAMTDTSSCGGVAADQRYEACLVLTPGLIDATGVNASVKVDDVAGNS
ncbi:MAG: S8 family serine peptidase, partial [Candidatus Gracilibacteria bacterium]|nr:S8 family serine peptidase [Candidatus Gracilibacteria bacterium]